MRFEFLGTISRICHASGGKIRFEASGPGGKILGLRPLFSLTSSVAISAKRTARYVARHITLSFCSFKPFGGVRSDSPGEAPGLSVTGQAAQPHGMPTFMKKSSTPSAPAPSGETNSLRYHENETGITATARAVR